MRSELEVALTELEKMKKNCLTRAALHKMLAETKTLRCGDLWSKVRRASALRK